MRLSSLGIDAHAMVFPRLVLSVFGDHCVRFVQPTKSAQLQMQHVYDGTDVERHVLYRLMRMSKLAAQLF